MIHEQAIMSGIKPCYFPHVRVAPPKRPGVPLSGCSLMNLEVTSTSRVRVVGFTDPEHAAKALEISRTRPLYCQIGESLITKVSEFPADGGSGDTYMCHPSLLSHIIGSYICDVCTLTDEGTLVVTVSWGFELTARDPGSAVDMLESMM